MNRAKVSVFSNVCPKCHEGHVFRHFLFIEKRCSSCDLEFEKEEGYFFGPMIIAYFITLLLALPLLLFFMFKEEPDFGIGVFATSILCAIAGPILYRYSKLVWLHAETGFGRTMQAEKDRAEVISKTAASLQHPYSRTDTHPK